MATRELGGMADTKGPPPDDPEPQTPEGRKWYERYKGERGMTVAGIVLGFFLGCVWSTATRINSAHSSEAWSAALLLAVFGLPCLWLIFRK